MFQIVIIIIIKYFVYIFYPNTSNSHMLDGYKASSPGVNPLTTVAISKLLERLVDLHIFLASCDRSRLGHKPDCRLAWSSRVFEKINACIPQCVCCVQASRDAPATRRNRVSSDVNSHGSPVTQWASKGQVRSSVCTIQYNTTVFLERL